MLSATVSRSSPIGKTGVVRTVTLAVLVLFVLSTVTGCVYFNTFYHAKKYFSQAEKQRKGGTGGRGTFGPGNRFYLDAVDKCSKILEDHPDSKWVDDALFMMGKCYYFIGEYTKSESAFRELLASHPDSKFAGEGQLFLARCKLELHRDREAFALFDELIVNAKDKKLRAAALFNRGEILYQRGAYDSAFADFSVIRDEHPKSEDAARAMILMGDGQRRLENDESAIAAFRWVLNRSDKPMEHFAANTGIGRTFYQAGFPDSGIAVFTKLAGDEQFDDSLAVIQLLWGQGLEAIKAYDAAFAKYELVISEKPRTEWSAEAYYRMGRIAQTIDLDLIRAKELFDAASNEQRGSEYGVLALTHSASIAKLEKFRSTLNRGEWLSSAGRRGAKYSGGRFRSADEALPDHADIVYSLVHYAPGGYEAQMKSRRAREAKIADSVKAPESVVAIDSTVHGPPAPQDNAEGDSIVPQYASIGDIPATGLETVDSNFIGPVIQTGAGEDSLKTQQSQSQGRHIVVPSAVQLAQQREDSILAAHQDSLLASHLNLYGPPITAEDMQTWIYADPVVNRQKRRLRNLYGPPRAIDFVQWSVLTPGDTPDGELSPRELAVRDSIRTLEERLRADSISQAETRAKLLAAVNTQFELAELYWFDLGLPDSAMVEYALIEEKAPEDYLAAKALLARAKLTEESFTDTVEARGYYRQIVDKYPETDFARDAIDRLGLSDTAATKEFPYSVYKQAERALIEDEDPARAILLFERLETDYPGSTLAPQAAFAAINLRERYFPPEDSSLVFAYQSIETKYKGTEYADAAHQILNPPKPQKPKPKPKPQQDVDPLQREIDSLRADARDTLGTTAGLPRAPIPKFKGVFNYPESQLLNPWRGKLVYSIYINFTGEIEDYALLQSSGVTEIDDAGRIAVEGTSFNADSIPPESLNMEYVYEIEVIPPATEYDEFKRLGIEEFELPKDNEAKRD